MSEDGKKCVNGGAADKTETPQENETRPPRQDSPILIDPDDVDLFSRAQKDPSFDVSNGIGEKKKVGETEAASGSSSEQKDLDKAFDDADDFMAAATDEAVVKCDVTNAKSQDPVETRESRPSEIRKNIWVSNFGDQMKASILKKHFSQIGKVLTAKVLTNGKCFYGYIVMETAKFATKAIIALDNSLLNGNKITVSRNRPDLRETKVPAKPVDARKKLDYLHNKRAKETTLPLRKNRVVRDEAKPVETASEKSVIDDLRRKLRNAYADVADHKKRCVDYHRKQEALLKKVKSLDRELEKVRLENAANARKRTERRKLDQDRAEFEKFKKQEETRLEMDKSFVTKELAEIKRLRENLRQRIDEYKDGKAKAMKRARSPVPRHVRSPARSRSPAKVDHRFRNEERVEKRFKRHEPVRTRTPPPPTIKRVSDTRNYFSENEKKNAAVSQPPEYRQRPFLAQPQVSYWNSYQAMISKDVRRSNPVPVPSQHLGSKYQYAPPPPPMHAVPGNVYSYYDSHY